MSKLTEDQKRIAENCGVAPADVFAGLRRTSANSADGDADGGDEQDEVARAMNHLSVCNDEGEDHLGRVTSARDCLNSYLAKQGQEVKNSFESAGIVFAHHRR